MVHPVLIETVLFENPGSGQNDYHLSGIGYTPGASQLQNALVVPPHGKAYIGQPPLYTDVKVAHPMLHPFPGSQTKCGPYFEGYISFTRLKGYVIHARCWTLAEKWVDQLEKLDLLVAGLQKRWLDIKDFTINRARNAGREKKEAAARYRRASEIRVDEPDPVYIPGLQEILDESVKRRSRPTRTRITRQLPKIPFRIFTQRFSLPVEILYMILDRLKLDDVVNCVVAFAEELSGQYWRQRFADFIFEVNEIDPEQIDWVYLLSTLWQRGLYKPGGALHTRREIFQRLKSINEYMNEQEHPANAKVDRLV
ncbi:hypothetical protein PHISCL_02326 [Aspergillus sclerotialis]|uniref:Uncharacterized protein n=1 Tax=Aspergillus sclerotialis TaxID=2070753 RepID=A0A3A2ZSR3_9EURO|nr:hypothetical protein PHISCL_02326 [Aspergillus sclerotialis]